MFDSSRLPVLEALLRERARQDQLWGIQNHVDAWWNVIATEEAGEVAREIYEHNDKNLFTEVIQTCAVYFQWAEAIHGRQQLFDQ